MSHAIGHTALLEQVSASSREIVSLSDISLMRLLRSEAFIRSFYLIYKTRQVLHVIDKLEKRLASECAMCSLTETVCIAQLRDDIKAMWEGATKLIDSERQIGLPQLLIKAHSRLAERLEDKYENYLIASNPELKETVQAFLKKPDLKPTKDRKSFMNSL